MNIRLLWGMALVGCSAGSGASSITPCSGSYTCTDGTTMVSTELQESDGVCTAGDLALEPNGVVMGVSNATWSGSAEQFEVCTEGDCLVCTPVGSPPPASDACSPPTPDANNRPLPQAIMATTARAATMGNNVGQECYAPEMLFEVPLSNVAPDTTNTSLMVVANTSDVSITCHVVQTATGSYDVSLLIEETYANDSVTVTGTFPPRSRDVYGTPNDDDAQINGITMGYLDEFNDLQQTNCFAQYVFADPNGQPGNSLPDVADTYADANGGRIWVSVFCEDPQSLGAVTNLWAGCQMSATFRVENCSSN
jgi:hypothetical protein